MRIAAIAAAICLSVTGISLAQNAEAAVKKTTNIPAQGLGPALQAFAKDRGLQLVYLSDAVDALTTGGATGEFTSDEALKQLLTGTGLSYRYLDNKTVTIFPSTGTALPPAKSSMSGDSTASRNGAAMRLARAAGNEDAAANSAASESTEGKPTGAANEGGSDTLNEIIVTAQKRSERLQDVPVPVTSVSATALVDSSQFRLQDYFTRIPGLSVETDAFGAPKVAIRGITTGAFSNPTVGVVIDDVGYGPSLAQAGGGNAPDIDPSDLARVEVLRGPQGTLYGASSMGGLLKFVTVDPSTDRLSGRVQAGASSVSGGDDLGYNVSAAVNVPLSESWAVRVSGFSRREAGYIDDPSLGLEDLNRLDVEGGRVSALWKPSDATSLKLSALVQNHRQHGSPLTYLLPGLSDLQQQEFIKGFPGTERDVQAYSATLTTKLGRADLAVVSGYSVNKFYDALDLTRYYGGLADLLFGVSASGADDRFKTSKFTQEVRVTVPLSDRIDWLLGAFYTDEDNDGMTNYLAIDPATGSVGGLFLQGRYPTSFQEYAAFTDLTFRITDRFDIQVGGRESQNRQTYSADNIAHPVFGGDSTIPEKRTRESAFTYLVTPRLKLAPNVMAYARLASGYRAGGPNGNGGAGVPPDYSADRTSNYEVGLKGDFLDRRLTVDASLYYIDWKDIQILLLNSAGAGYLANGSRAKSQGVELSIEARPVNGLAIAAWVAWSDAQLTEEFPAGSTAIGGSGDRLPVSSRLSGNFSIDQTFAVTSSMAGYVGGSLSYVGDRIGPFASIFVPVPQRQALASYAKIDLRAGVKFDTWTINAFLNNVADRRGVLAGGLGTTYDFAFNYIQPRTAGLSIAKEF